MADGLPTPPSEEVVIEQVYDVIQWVIDHCQQVPDPGGALTVMIPLYEDTATQHDPTGQPYAFIKIHGNRAGKVIFESPWIVVEIDPAAVTEHTAKKKSPLSW